jgi:branched-chain amino acid transport system substrate-binding protein
MRILLMSLALLLSSFALFAQSNVIHIGAIFNLTGRQSMLGTASLQGAQLAVKQINSSQGVLGRKLQLVTKNGQTNPAVLTRIAKGFMTNDQVNLVIGLSDNNMVLIAAPLIVQAGKLFITTGATSPLLPLTMPKHFFMACFGDNTQAAAAAEFAYQRLKVKRVAVLYDEGMNYSKGLQAYFVQRFKAMGGHIVYRAPFAHVNPSITKQLQAIKQIKPLPQLLYLASGPAETPKLIQAVRKAGLTMPILGGDAYDAKAIIGAMGKKANNIYYTTHGYYAFNNPPKKIRLFVHAYFKAYHQLPTAYAGLAYDTIYLLKSAMIKAQSATADAVAHALDNTHHFVGVTGSMDYSVTQHMPKKSVAIVGIRSGKSSFIAEWHPTKVPMAML